MADEARRHNAVQFHPEVTHTLQGGRLLERFMREICACEARCVPGNVIAHAVARVREQVGSDKVLGLSGSVDSSVVAALLHLAGHLRHLDQATRDDRVGVPGHTLQVHPAPKSACDNP